MQGDSNTAWIVLASILVLAVVAIAFGIWSNVRDARLTDDQVTAADMAAITNATRTINHWAQNQKLGQTSAVGGALVRARDFAVDLINTRTHGQQAPAQPAVQSAPPAGQQGGVQRVQIDINLHSDIPTVDQGGRGAK